MVSCKTELHSELPIAEFKLDFEFATNIQSGQERTFHVIY